MKYQRSSQLFKQAKSVIPGGVNSPVRAFKAVGGNPVFVERAEGAYLYDVDGNRLIDYINSWGPMIMGHAFKPVLDAIIEKAKNGGYILNLPDTKNLSVLAVPKAYDSPRLVLNHGNDGWWKGLVKFKQTDPTYWEEIVCVTSGKTTSANYLNPDLATDYIVTISYAKDWGAHTNMYSIRNLENFDSDHDWYFIWLKGS